jgi:hypothetical protein
VIVIVAERMQRVVLGTNDNGEAHVSDGDGNARDGMGWDGGGKRRRGIVYVAMAQESWNRRVGETERR